ncbi:TlpA family protein disulfide reductase [Candidatus Bipolaricaulota bacterium]|nr:TlpA family protein disulfide reductase [Candidatus Bipolaricaulota bacterium]MCK5584958.1 TlpA family protein disulfide reductase [Candidatus Bipolaricaulota bacterium]
MRNIGLLVGIAVAGLLLATLLFSGGEKVPEMAPDFSLESLDGETVTLSELRGNVVVIDFWATWCSPCLRSFPSLHAVVDRHQDRGVILLLVSLDKTAKRARDYLVENGYPTENVLWESLDAARDVKALFGVVGIPRTFVIDRDGFIQYSGHPGRLSDADLLEWL